MFLCLLLYNFLFLVFNYFNIFFFNVSRYCPSFLIFYFALKMPFDRSLRLCSSAVITDVNPWGQTGSEKAVSFSPHKRTFLKY